MSSAAGSTTHLSIEFDQGLARLDCCRSDWERLFQQGRYEPSASWEWTIALARHQLGSGDRCLVLRFRRGTRIVGLVPLIARQARFLVGDCGLLMPLSELSATHSDLLLADDDEAAEAFVSALTQLDVEWDCFRMGRLLASNPLVPRLQRAFRAAHLQVIRPGIPAYHLDLPGSFDAYLTTRGAKFRNHLKRVTRKLERAGRVSVHAVTDPSRLDPAYAALLEIERGSWKHATRSSIAAVPTQTAFYRELAAGALETGRLHLQWLTLDGRPLAYNLGYLTAAGYHYLKTSYVQESRPLSPSTYLRAQLVRELIDLGARQFDFPGEPYEWETQWATSLRPRTVLAAYPRSLRGRLLALRERVHPLLRPAQARQARSGAPAPSA